MEEICFLILSRLRFTIIIIISRSLHDDDRKFFMNLIIITNSEYSLICPNNKLYVVIIIFLRYRISMELVCRKYILRGYRDSCYLWRRNVYTKSKFNETHLRDLLCAFINRSLNWLRKMSFDSNWWRHCMTINSVTVIIRVN